MVSINGQTLNINEACFFFNFLSYFPGSQTFGFRDEGLFWDEVTGDSQNVEFALIKFISLDIEP